MNLTFNPLCNGVMNARIPVKDGVVVSVSKGSMGYGCGYVGEDGDYQCAIMVNDSAIGDHWCLVYLAGGDTVKNHCTDSDIEDLARIAHRVVMVNNIWVFDTLDKQPDRWCYRFTTTNQPRDTEKKMECAKYIWPGKHLVLPLGIKPPLT
jgi:hypothetical protein